MKKIVTSIGIFSLCAAVASVALAQMPSSDPDALWKYISKESPYSKWSFWPDHQGMQAGNAPHGPLHKVFVNDQALSSTKPPANYGSIAVKENYGQDKQLKAITVMYKIAGYNPEAGDWFWAKYSPDGKADKFGKAQGCIDCHVSKNTNDFVYVHEFK